MKLKTLAAGTAVVGLVALAGPAFAAGPPYTVAVGGNSAAGTESVSAASTGTVQFSARNNAGTVVNMNCTSVSGSATVTRGAGVNPVGAISSTTWTGCRVPGGAATVTQGGSWNITGTGTNATSALTDSIAGFVGNVSAGVATTANPAICSFTAVGQASGSFNENGGTGQQLVVSETGYTGNLTLTNVSGCLGQLQNGNPANFAATLNLTSPNGAINLS